MDRDRILLFSTSFQTSLHEVGLPTIVTMKSILVHTHAISAYVDETMRRTEREAGLCGRKETNGNERKMFLFFFFENQLYIYILNEK